MIKKSDSKWLPLTKASILGQPLSPYLTLINQRLIEYCRRNKKKGADLKVLNINLDTKSPTGQLMLTMLAVIA